MSEWIINVEHGDVPFAKKGGDCWFLVIKKIIYEAEKRDTKSNQNEGAWHDLQSCQKGTGNLRENVKVFPKNLLDRRLSS